MYKAELVKATRELSKREKIRIKDFQSFLKLQDIPDDTIIENVTGLFSVHVENDKSESKEYVAHVIEVNSGENYVYTSSDPFNESMVDILGEFIGEDGFPVERIDVQVKRIPSKNNSGKISKAVLV